MILTSRDIQVQPWKINSWNLKINTILEKENHLNQTSILGGFKILSFKSCIANQIFKNISGIYDNRPLLSNEFGKKTKDKDSSFNKIYEKNTHLPGYVWESSNIFHPVHISTISTSSIFNSGVVAMVIFWGADDWQLLSVIFVHPKKVICWYCWG